MRKKILLIKIWAIGEVALATPCISRLKKEFPDSELHFLVGNNARDIIENNPNISRVYSVSEKAFLKPYPLRLAKMIIDLRKERYDIIVTLHHAPLFSVFSFFLGAKVRIGLKREGAWSLNTADFINRGGLPKILEYLKVLENLSIKIEDEDTRMAIYPSDEDRRHIRSLMRENGIGPKNFIILSPTGGENPAAAKFDTNIKNKAWPVEHYVELCDLIVKNSSRKVVIVGSDSEKEKARKIKASHADEVVDLVGRTNLRELIVLADEALISVTNDSGPMSVMNVSTTPLIAIFGPTDPCIICLPSSHVTVVREGMSCSPCFDGSVFPNKMKACKDPLCMKNITPHRIFKKIQELL